MARKRCATVDKNAYVNIIQEVSMPEVIKSKHLPDGGCNQGIAEVLDLVSTVLSEHVKFQNKTDADALALWIAMTHVMDHLEIAL